MNLFYHHPANGNVGDDLNAVLWPRLLPEFEQLTCAEWLVGAGTIIDRRLFALPGKKIVLGAGYRPAARCPRFGSDVEFAGVRGELTAQALGLGRRGAVCDPGFVVASWPEYQTDRRGSTVGLVPHIYSEDSSGMVAAAAAAGLDVISPRLSVDEFLRRLARCSRVYCESLHAAIFADSLRVPWARVLISAHYYEGRGVNDFKWRDAFSVMGVDVKPANVVGLVPIKRSWPAMGVLMHPVQVLAENRLATLLYRMRNADVFRLSDEGRVHERVDEFLRRVQALRQTAVEKVEAQA
jgi:succinoglycan biosynthesis protein ExoV